MAISRGNPLGFGILGTAATQDPIVNQQLLDLIENIKDTDAGASKWIERQKHFIKLQFGPRDQRNFPWPDASNVNVPMTEGIIRRFRPGLAALVLDANPVATFVSPDERDDAAARKAEPFWHWLFLEKMNPEREILRVIDLMANRGHAYTREGWEYRTELRTRSIPVREIFGGDFNAWLQTARVAAEQQGREFVPLEAVMALLADQYQMDIQDDFEGNELVSAARAILEGADYAKIRYREVIKDQPALKAIDPINVIVDQDEDRIEDAEFFAIIHQMTAETLRQKVRDGHFDAKSGVAIAEELEGSDADRRHTKHADAEGQRASIRDLVNRRTGLSKRQRRHAGIPRTPVWEIFAKLDVNGDGIKERVVIWWSVVDEAPLSVIEYPFALDHWPVTLYQFEPHAARPYESRGVPELLYDLQRELNADHNNRRDLAQLLLNPPIEYEMTGMDPDSMPEWAPGVLFPVVRKGSVGPMQFDLRPLTQLLAQENQTQRIAESFIGTFDATITNLSAGRERRTASEVNAITQLAANVFGLDARMFQKAFGRTLSNLWAIWLDLGDEQMYFRATGEQKPQIMKKSEVGKHFDIKPAGTPSSTNRGFMLSNMQQVIPLAAQDPTGRIDFGELLSSYIQLLDPKLSEKIVRTQEQATAAQRVIQAAQVLGDQAGVQSPSQI